MRAREEWAPQDYRIFLSAEKSAHDYRNLLSDENFGPRCSPSLGRGAPGRGTPFEGCARAGYPERVTLERGTAFEGHGRASSSAPARRLELELCGELTP